MKHNIIFTVLTAVILALGFYAMDIAELFGFGSTDEKLIKTEKTGANLIFLSQTNSQINPMELIEGDLSVPDSNTRSVASAIVKTMAENSDLTSIKWGIRTELMSSWQISENNYIFIKNWEYVNKRMNKRRLDCILNAENFTVVYIRFYDRETNQPSAGDMNRGLERLDKASDEFYPKLDEIIKVFEDKIHSIKENDDDVSEERIFIQDYFMEEQFISPENHFDLLRKYCQQYSIIRKITEETINSELAKFWIPPLAVSTIILDEKANKNAEGVLPIMEAFLNEPNQTDPEYTAYGECIYQTFTLGDNSLTVIYNVFSNTVEGYFYK